MMVIGDLGGYDLRGTIFARVENGVPLRLDGVTPLDQPTWSLELCAAPTRTDDERSAASGRAVAAGTGLWPSPRPPSGTHSKPRVTPNTLGVYIMYMEHSIESDSVDT